jgi:ParB-like chromosome segregation protein Spo0J
MSETIDLQIKYLPLDELTPYRHNARLHPPAQIRKLRASLAEFGWTNPILHAEGQIIAGHARLTAAVGMRHDKQPIRHHPNADVAPTIDLSHLAPDQRRAYVLADNRVAEDSDWDLEMLRAELTGLMATPSIELEVTGFGYEQLREVIFPKPSVKDVDASQQKLDAGLSYQIVIECTDENDQADLLGELRGREIKCRALIA